MKNDSKEKRRRKRRAMSQAMLIILLTVMSLATDGFGAAPPSQFSEDFREQLSEALPAELVEEVNQYLTDLNAVTIPAQVVDAVEDVDPASSPSVFGEEFRMLLGEIFPVRIIESLNNILAIPIPYVDAGTPSTETGATQSPEELAEELLAAVRTQEALASPSIADAQQRATALSNLTPSAIPISTFTPSPTPIASPSPSPAVVWYPWSPTPTEIPNHKPTCSGFNASNPQTTGILNIDISSLCSDSDGDAWSLNSVTQGTNGASTFGAKNINYDPNDGFAGTDNLTFTIRDEQGGLHTQSFDVIISNSPPIANVDTANADKNSTTAIAISVLNNDFDPGGDILTLTGVSSIPTGATVSIVGTTVEYIPPTGFSGTSNFIYTIQDTHGAMRNGIVNVTVNNSPPTCSGFNYSNPQTTGLLNIDLSSLCNDPNGDTWSLSSVAQGSNGTTTFGATSISYNPNDGFAGTDNISFTIDDGDTGGTYTQAFDIIISNLPPTTTADSATVLQDSGANLISVLTNDSDPGNDLFTITNITQGFNGTVEVPAGNTTLTYRPAAGFSGADSFTYTVTDTHGGSTTGTVSVTVTPATTAIICDQPNTAGCIINHIQFNGNLATSIYVQPSETLLLGIGAQGWDTICPTCSYSFAFGIESTMLGCANPLTNSYISTGSYITASATPGTYNIYANINENSCDYLNPSTSVAQVHVCAPVTAQVNNGNCYTGPSTSYATDGWLANTTMWNEITAQSADFGSLFYELTSPSWSCWIEASTMIIATQGDLTNCVPYKSVAPPAPSHITMYNAGTSNGDMGGRSGADALCAGSRPAGYTKSHAFISVDLSDAITGMPANYSIPTTMEIKSTNDTSIANNWSDLIAGTFNATLHAAGVLPLSNSYWWNGNRNGDVSGSSNCNLWTDGSLTFMGRGAWANATGLSWFGNSATRCSATNVYLVCIAYP